jgi:hypothetical protein
MSSLELDQPLQGKHEKRRDLIDPVTVMNQQSVITTNKRSIWLRGLFMVLMALVYQLCGTLLFIIAVIQFVIALLNDAPNARLVAFGRSLGLYIRQIADYLVFATDEVPFPFSDWPSAE